MQQNTELTDKFNNRLVIPIFNLNGQVVGFSGRIIEKLENSSKNKNIKRPKYLNSPNSDWFCKRELWFGLDKAQNSIKKQGFALIVEGHLDVITAHRLGLENTIASQGTSFTLDQLKILQKFCSKVWLCFDRDTAGKIAAEKFFKLASQLNFEVFQVLLPDIYKDLDEYLLNLEKFTKQINSSKQQEKFSINLSVKPFLDFIFEQESDNFQNTQTNLQRQTILNFLNLVSFTDKLSQMQYLQKLNNITNLGLSVLKEFLDLASQKNLAEKAQKNLDIQTLKQKQEVKIKIPKEVTSKNNLVLAFQILVILYLQKKLTTDLSNCLPILLEILKILLNWHFESWAAFLQEEKEHLNFIAEEISQNLEPKDATIYLKIILNYLDREKFWLLYPEFQKYTITLYRLSLNY